MNKENNKTFSIVLTTVIVLLALGAGSFLIFKDSTPPSIAISPEATELGKGAEITIDMADPGSGLQSITIVGIQGDTTIPLIQKTFPGGTMKTKQVIKLDKGEFKEGQFTIVATAQDASLYPFGTAGLTKKEKTFTFDATPPRIFVQSHTNNLNQGGSGLMVYALSEKAEKTGIRVGKNYFPAYLQPSSDNKNIYYCMFAVPWYTPPAEFKPFIEASDKAGNTAKHSFNYHVNARHFRRDRIPLSDAFMERIIPEFHGLIPDDGGTLLAQYLYINNKLRKENRAKLAEFSRQTAPTILWEGTFKRLPNAANRAGYADSRDYIYKGEKVDFQTHLGLDLASIKHAPVPAANNGKIIYADFLGIYGNVVVIDHGLGLQTLYAHLSSINVQPGDMVSKGDIIGNTGSTGLAGGDHLHYGVIVAGIPVQPIEWWDKSWIRNNITSKIE